MNVNITPFPLQKAWGIQDDVIIIGDKTIAMADVEKVWGFKTGRGGVMFSLQADGKTYILSATLKKGNEGNTRNAEEAYHYLEKYIINKGIEKRTTMHYKRCDACGRVFAVSEAELEYADRLMGSAAKDSVLGMISSASQLASGMYGAYVGKNMQEQADKKMDQALTVGNCPYCKSSMTFDISEEDYDTLHQQQSYKDKPADQASVSVADEIKKFKELLDIGAITQEEFDAKKKQLLGL